jgi:hypothetical protein
VGRLSAAHTTLQFLGLSRRQRMAIGCGGCAPWTDLVSQPFVGPVSGLTQAYRTLPIGTTYYIHYLEAGLTAGGFMYTSCKLHEICWGVIESFLRGHTFRFPRRTTAAVSLLRRILVYVHEVIGKHPSTFPER